MLSTKSPDWSPTRNKPNARARNKGWLKYQSKLQGQASLTQKESKERKESNPRGRETTNFGPDPKGRLPPLWVTPPLRVRDSFQYTESLEGV